MMKVDIDQARVEIRGQFAVEGAVLAETVQARCDGITATLRITSSAPQERVASLIRNAENGCYTLQTIRNPVKATTTVELNGAEFDYLNVR